MTEFTMSQFANKDDLIAAQAQHIKAIEAQLEAVGAGGVESLRTAPAPAEPAGCYPAIDRKDFDSDSDLWAYIDAWRHARPGPEAGEKGDWVNKCIQRLMRAYAASATQAGAANPAAPVVLPEPVAWLIERSAFRVSPHGQDAESNEWLEEAHEPGEEGSFRVYTEQQVHTLLASLSPPAPKVADMGNPIAQPYQQVAMAMAETWEQSAADTEHQCGGVGPDYNQGLAEGMRICAKDLRAALAATPAAKAEVQAEPVAWRIPVFDHEGGFIDHLLVKYKTSESCEPLYTSPQATQQDAIDAAKWRFVRASPDHAVCAMDRGHGWYAVTDAAIQAAQQGGRKP